MVLRCGDGFCEGFGGRVGLVDRGEYLACGDSFDDAPLWSGRRSDSDGYKSARFGDTSGSEQAAESYLTESEQLKQ